MASIEFEVVNFDSLAFYLAQRYSVDDDGCWVWNSTIDRDGYGVAHWEQKSWRAHRRVYTHNFGAIAEGLELDHTCEVRACVNPAHLEPVTMLENWTRIHLRRGLSRDVAAGLAVADIARMRRDSDARRRARTLAAAAGVGPGVTVRRGKATTIWRVIRVHPSVHSDPYVSIESVKTGRTDSVLLATLTVVADTIRGED